MSVPRWSANVEGLVEVRILLEVVPARRPRDEDQVPRRRDRQQLGRALVMPRTRACQSESCPGVSPYAQRCQHDREKKRRAGEDDDDVPPAHAREYCQCVSVGGRPTDVTAALSRSSSGRRRSFPHSCPHVGRLAVEMLKRKTSQIAATTFSNPLHRFRESLDCQLRRAQSASRSKPSPKAVAGRRKSAETVDESETGPANFFGPV